MTTRLLASSALALALSLLAAAPDADAQQGACLAIEDAMRRAAELHPAVDLARAEREAAEAGLTDARALSRPRLSAFGRAGTGDTQLAENQIENQVGLRLSQRVFDFGDARLAREAARESVRAREQMIRDVSLEAALDAVDAYLGVLEADARLAALAEREAFFQRQLDALDALPRGAATRAERAEVAGRLAASQAAQLETRFVRSRAAARLQTLSGRGDGLCGEDWAEVYLGEAAGDLRDALAAREQGLAFSPLIAQLEAEVRAAEAAARRERRNRLPAIDVVGTAAYIYDDRTEDWDYRDRVGVDVSVPLYSGAALDAGRRRAAAEAAAAEAQLRDARREVAEAIEIGARRALSLEAQVVRRGLAEEQAAVRFAAAREEFAAGARTLPDLIEVRLDYEQSVLDVIAARFELRRQQAELALLTGALDPVRGLEATR